MGAGTGAQLQARLLKVNLFHVIVQQSSHLDIAYQMKWTGMNLI
jgi:hypothetical protein